LFCIYEGPVEREGRVVGGAVNLRTRQGFVIAAFADEGMANWFLKEFKLDGGTLKRSVIPLAQLGTTEFPRRATKGLPQPFRKIVFPSMEVLAAWAKDREKFDTAPLVSKL
jgi:hypothetical protein